MNVDDYVHLFRPRYLTYKVTPHAYLKTYDCRLCSSSMQSKQCRTHARRKHGGMLRNHRVVLARDCFVRKDLVTA